MIPRCSRSLVRRAGVKFTQQAAFATATTTKIAPDFSELSASETNVHNFQDHRLLTVKNGERVQYFSKKEMDGRMRACREEMEKLQVDACIFTSFHNIKYLADFLYCQFGRNYGLVVTPEEATTVTPLIDGGQPWRRGSNVENLVFTDWRRDNYFHALKTLLAKNAKRRIGVEFDALTLAQRDQLQETFPGAEFVDIGKQMSSRRTIKSAEEIKVIREGARICDVGGDAVCEAMAPGVPEYVVAGHATSAMRAELARAHPDADLMDTWTWFQGGINTDGAHNPVTARPLEKGDICSLNTFAHVHGYYTALERTLFMNEASDAHLQYWAKLCEVHRLGHTLMRPGMRCCDIAKECNEKMAELGILQWRTFGYGHSFGVLSHYYGREAAVELREDVETVLEPGMVVSMEPMIMIPEGKPGAGGYREHDIFVIHEKEGENITGFPFGPNTKCVVKAGQ